MRHQRMTMYNDAGESPALLDLIQSYSQTYLLQYLFAPIVPLSPSPGPTSYGITCDWGAQFVMTGVGGHNGRLFLPGIGYPYVLEGYALNNFAPDNDFLEALTAHGANRYAEPVFSLLPGLTTAVDPMLELQLGGGTVYKSLSWWQDYQGRSRIWQWWQVDDSEAIIDAAQEYSYLNCYQKLVAVNQEYDGGPSESGTSSLLDTAILEFASSTGETVRLSIPAPIESVWRKDYRTVDPSAVADLIDGFIANGLSSSASTIARYTGSRRQMLREQTHHQSYSL